eukprot:COSAG05_NODE_1342_length_5140_cov_2.897838_6_plen_66_part_00
MNFTICLGVLCGDAGLKLAVQNLGRLSFVTIMSKLLILLGKIQIAMVSAITCALCVESQRCACTR